jgi:hypothetical protein
MSVVETKKPAAEFSAAGEELTRVNIRVSREVHRKMLTLIPWGLRRNVIEAVLKLVLDAVEKDGIVVAGALLDGKFKLYPTVQSTKRIENPIDRHEPSAAQASRGDYQEVQVDATTRASQESTERKKGGP